MTYSSKLQVEQNPLHNPYLSAYDAEVSTARVIPRRRLHLPYGRHDGGQRDVDHVCGTQVLLVQADKVSLQVLQVLHLVARFIGGHADSAYKFQNLIKVHKLIYLKIQKFNRCCHDGCKMGSF